MLGGGGATLNRIVKEDPVERVTSELILSVRNGQETKIWRRAFLAKETEGQRRPGGRGAWVF